MQAPRFARPLLVAIERPAGAASSIATYLADWSMRTKPTDRIGSLDRVAPGDSYGKGFFGHWAFDQAAPNAGGRRAALRGGFPGVPTDLLVWVPQRLRRLHTRRASEAVWGR